MFCKQCGREISDKAVLCVKCGAATDIPPHKENQPDAITRMLLPVGRSGYAIAAGYLGLFSVLLIFAPFALLFGILAVRDIKNNRDKHGMGRAVFGIVMGAIFSIALVITIIFALMRS